MYFMHLWAMVKVKNMFWFLSHDQQMVNCHIPKLIILMSETCVLRWVNQLSSRVSREFLLFFTSGPNSWSQLRAIAYRSWDKADNNVF